MPRFMRSFILMITFLTRIPIPMRFEFNTEDFVKGFIYFPIVGAIIGGILVIPFVFLDYVKVSVFAFLLIILYLLVVGGLHIDGISDVFDGIFSARKKDRMLEIMEDSRVGAFGVVGLVIYFIGLYIALVEVIQLEQGLLYVFLMPIVGRTMALVGAGFSSYAKSEGLGKSLIDGTKPIVSLCLIVVLCVGAYVINLSVFISVVLTTCLVLMIIWRIHKLLDGITGDVVGLLVEVSQVAFLLSLTIF